MTTTQLARTGRPIGRKVGGDGAQCNSVQSEMLQDRRRSLSSCRLGLGWACPRVALRRFAGIKRASRLLTTSTSVELVV